MKTLDTIAANVEYLTKSHDEFREETKTDLKEIKAQTQRTNGRVSKAESDIADLQEYNERHEKDKDNRSERYIAPIITGLLIGGVLFLADLITS